MGALNGWTMILGEVTQSLARHQHFPKAWARENRRGAPAVAFVLTGSLASVMLLCNYTQSINGLFALLSEIVTAANLPVYFTCTLAILIMGRRRGTAGPQKPTVRIVGAGLCATAYCTWVSVGFGIKPLLWTLVLGAACAPVYWWPRLRQLALQSG
jgi:APA family basic amino acid/polyamine antiporter